MDGNNPGQEPGEGQTGVEGQDPATQGDGARTTSSQRGTSAQQPVLPAQMPTDDDDESWASLPKWVRDLRKENASRRKKAEELQSSLADTQSRLEALEQRDLSEQEKELARLRKLEQEELPRLTRANRELMVENIARDLDVVDPEVALKLLDWDQVEKGTDVRELLTDLLEKKPYLKKSSSSSSSASDSSAGGEGGETSKGRQKPQTPPNRTSSAAPSNGHEAPRTFSRAALKDMSPDQINELFEKGDLAEALEKGRVTE